jgi:hypothetical protein
VPKLLDRVDSVLALMERAAAAGLAGELEVQRAAARLGRISNLIEMRDRVRVAVELCAPRRMMALMEERGALIRIFGPELLKSEADACAGMLGMLRYQSGIDGGVGIITRHASALALDGEAGPEDTAEASSAVFDEDSRLPPFARRALDEMRTASSAERLQETTHRFVCLVPDEQLRRSYIRAFKWVVAFAKWCYNRQDLADREGAVKDALARTHMHSQMQSSERDGGEAAPMSDRELLQKSESPISKEGAKSSSSGYGQRSGNGIIASSSSPSPSPSSSSSSLPSSPPSSSSKSEARLRSNSSRAVKFFSPGKTSSTATTTNPKTNTSKSPKNGTLFATRQARSVVAVNESIKKGKALSYEHLHVKTDRLIQDQIDDIERFRKAVKLPTWNG